MNMQGICGFIVKIKFVKNTIEITLVLLVLMVRMQNYLVELLVYGMFFRRSLRYFLLVSCICLFALNR